MGCRRGGCRPRGRRRICRGRVRGGAGEHGVAYDQRHGERGVVADRVDRHVDEQPGLLCVSVAALRERRHRLRRHQRRNRQDLHADLGRCVAHAEGRRDGHERRRKGLGCIGAERSHRLEERPGQHRQADRDRHCGRRRAVDRQQRQLVTCGDVVLASLAAL